MADRLIHQPANQEFDVPVIQRRRRFLWVSVLMGCCALVLLLGYTQTSHFGLGALRERLPASAEISVSAESFRFVGMNRIVGRDLTLAREGEVFFHCESLDLQVDLFAWLSGQIVVERFHLRGGEVDVIEQSKEFDQWTALWSGMTQRKSSSKTPLDGVAVRDVRVEQTTIRFHWEEWPEALIEFNAVDLQCDEFKPNQLSSISLNTDVLLVSDESNAVAATVSGDVSVDLLRTGVPHAANGGIELAFSGATGRLAGLNGRAGEIFLSVTPGQIKESGFRWTSGGEDIGSLVLQGPFNAHQMEGRVDVEVTPLRRPLLNLFGLVRGWEFGETEIGAEMTIDWKLGGSLISARGHVEGADVELQRDAALMPRTELTGDYSFQLNLAEGTLLLQRCELLAASEEKEWFAGRLESPVFLRWGGGRPGITEPQFTLTIDELDLQAWAAFLNVELPAGKISLQADSTVKRDGEMVLSDVTGRVDGLVVPSMNGSELNLRTEFAFASRLEQMKRFSIVDLKHSWWEADRSVLAGDGVFSYQFPDQSYSIQLVSRGGGSWIAQQLGWSDLELSAGDLKGTVRLQSKDESQDVVMSLDASGLNGRLGPVRLDDSRISLKLDVARSGDDYLLNSLSFEGGRGYTTAGSVGFNGKFDSRSRDGTLRFRSVGVNRVLWGDLVKPYIEPEFFGDASLKLGGQIGIEAGQLRRIEADVRVEQLYATNQVSGEISSLDLGVQALATVSGSQVSVRDGRLELAETDRSHNTLQFELISPVIRSSDGPGRLTLRSSNIDFTDYWDWVREIAGEAIVSDSGSETNVSVNPNGAISGLSQNWQVDLSLDEVQLRDLVLSNVVAEATLGRNTVIIDSLEASHDGGKIEGRWAANEHQDWVDYSIDLNATELPLREIVRTFDSDDPVGESFSGALNGRFTLDGRLATSDQAETNLEGYWETSVKSPVFPIEDDGDLLWLRPLLNSLNLPDLNSLVANRFYAGARFSGTALNVEELALDFESLRLLSQGQIPLRGELLNSKLDLPIEFSLQRQIAESVGLTLEPSSRNPAFITLPSLARLRGTIGDVEIDWDEVAIASLLSSVQVTGSEQGPNTQ